MIKTLGPWARLIPEEEQNTIVVLLSKTRLSPVHRGMLPFIPVKEILDAIRWQLSEAFFYNTKTQQVTAQGLYQQQHNQHALTTITTNSYGDKHFYELAYNAILVAASIAAIKDELKEETNEESTNESNSQPDCTSNRDLPLPS